MAPTRRPVLAAEARRRNQEQLARLGAFVRAARSRRRWTQAALAGRVGLSRASVSRIEVGRGGGLTVDTWQRVAVALGVPLEIRFWADRAEEPADAAHLHIQELLLRLARRRGVARTFESPTRPADPARSVDVGLRDDRLRLLVLCEAWNSMGDIGAAARATSRKVAQAEALAVTLGGDTGAYRVASVWVMRASARNRALLTRYGEIFATRFPGSSRAWVRALTQGGPPPAEPGLVLCDSSCRRLMEWRRRSLAA